MSWAVKQWLIRGVVALVFSAIAYWQFNNLYVGREKYDAALAQAKAAERERDAAIAEADEQRQRAEETLALYVQTSAKVATLNRFFDQQRATWVREMQDEATREWRAGSVPDPVVDGLRRAAGGPGGN